MAKINGLGALFRMTQINQYIDDKAQEYREKAIMTAQYLGEEFVNKARDIRTYQDRTGNLRSSIGYIVLYDGEVIDRNFKESEKGTDKKTGVSKAIDFAEELAGQYPNGLILIGMAGMEYAAAVEALNYDVITGSAPTSQDFKDIFSEIQF